MTELNWREQQQTEVQERALAMATRFTAQLELRRKQEDQRRQQRLKHIAEIKARVKNDYPGLSIARRTWINTTVLNNPTDNYVFSGPGGIGKSFLAAALGDIARESGRTVLHTSGQEWEAEMRRNASASFDNKQLMAVSALSLRRSQPCLIIFDEIYRVSKTQFVLDALLSVLDAVKAGGHQLVLTSNLSQSEFRFAMGDSIYWRIYKKADGKFGGIGCKWADFREKSSLASEMESV